MESPTMPYLWKEQKKPSLKLLSAVGPTVSGKENLVCYPGIPGW